MSDKTFTCEVDGCGKPKKGSTYCVMHYTRVRRHGSPHICLTDDSGAPQLFIERLVGTKEADCIHWPFSMCQQGYGRLYYNGKRDRAHRVICFLAHGPGGDLFATHACGNRSCVNPNHIRWGTPADNNRDTVKHGRRPSGDDHWTSKAEFRVGKSSYRNRSGVPGVHQSRSGKWFAKIRVRGESVHLGTYEKKYDAIAARRKAEREAFGG
jgi:hypothetical protein